MFYVWKVRKMQILCVIKCLSGADQMLRLSRTGPIIRIWASGTTHKHDPGVKKWIIGARIMLSLEPNLTAKKCLKQNPSCELERSSLRPLNDLDNGDGVMTKQSRTRRPPQLVTPEATGLGFESGGATVNHYGRTRGGGGCACNPSALMAWSLLGAEKPGYLPGCS